MALFTGTLAPAAAIVLPGAMSVLLSGATIPAPSSAASFRAPAAVAGARTLGTPAAAGTVSRAGVAAAGHDAQWFERIHVVPRRYDLAFLLSEQTVQVEVWNAFRARSRVLTGLTVTGFDGVQVDSPPTLPDVWPQTRSTVFVIRALATGGTSIDNTVTWIFAGIPIEQTDLQLTGSRLLPFPFPPNMAAGIDETRGYLTDLLEADDGSEQRVQLRGIPARGQAFETLSLEPQDAQFCSALVYGWIDGLFGVPLWQHSVRLTADAPVGSSTLAMPTADVPWSDGDLLFLWANPYAWEALAIDSMGAFSVTLTGLTQRAWPAGTIAVPMAVGRLSGEQPIEWVTNQANSARVDFAIEGGVTPAPAGSGTVYQGFDVLAQAPHNRRGSLTDTVARAVDVVDPGTGVRLGLTRAAAPNPARPFLWTCFSRAEVGALRDFIDSRRGRAVPFWVISHNQDLQLAADAASGASTLTIRWVGYANRVFALGGARRHLALYAPGVAPVYRQVIAATDPGTGDVESVSLDAPLPAALPAATTVVSFLRLCRLEEDRTTVHWITGRLAEAQLRFREIPQEAPA